MRSPEILLALVLLLVPALAGSEESALSSAEQAAREAVSHTVDDVLALLKDEKLSDTERRKRVEAIVYSRFDFSTITRLVLGRNWRELSEAQQQAFILEFKRHLSLTYGDTLKEYQDEEVVITRSRSEGNKDVSVRTEIRGAAAQPYLVDYRLREKDAEWLVIDVIAESVSLIQNFRTQTQEIISEVGADRLVEQLRQKNDAREKGKPSAS